MFMFALKVEKKLAQKAKELLQERKALDNSKAVFRDENYVYFPMLKRIVLPFGRVVEKKFLEQPRGASSLKDSLKSVLSKREMASLVSSFDVVGDIAIVEVRRELWGRRKIIANAVLKIQKHVKVVLAKKSAMTGEYRVREFSHLAGPRRFTAVYKESGCVLKVNLAKAYFSVRLSTERARIALLVKEKENVLVPFAGVGPFALVIAKKHPDAKVVAVELNPFAFKQLKENIALNKAGNVSAVEGDARVALKKYVGWADRVVMPLPHTGEDFLDVVLPCVKSGGVIHFYGFGPVESPFEELWNSVKRKCIESNRKARLVFKRVVRPYSPASSQVVLDFKVS